MFKFKCDNKVNKITNFLSNFDFVSPEITLFYEGKSSHSSLASGIISVILIILIVIFTTYVSSDFLFRQNPSAYFYSRYIDDIKEHKFNSKGLFHFIYFNNGDDFNIPINTSIFSIVGVDLTHFPTDNNESNYDHYIYEACDSTDAGDLYDIIKEDNNVSIYFSNAFCIKKFYNSSTKEIINNDDKNFVYPKLQHGTAKTNNLRYGVYIQKCQNILTKKCYESLNDEYFINLFNNNSFGYSISFIEHYIDVDNYNNPIKTSFQRISNTFNKNTYTANHLNYRPINLKTNNGIFFDKVSEKDTFNYYLNEKLTLDSNFSVFGSFNFWIQNQLDSYNRTYKKIWDIAGDVDGVIEILMLLIKFINLVIFNDFQTIHDFNEEIEKKVEKSKTEQNLNFNIKKQLSRNNSINQFLDTPTKNILNLNNNNKNKNKTFKRSNSKISICNNNYQTKIEKSYQEVKWSDLIFNVKLKCNENKYIKYLVEQRERIISEEMMLKNYLQIKKLREAIVGIADNNNMNNGKEESLLINFEKSEMPLKIKKRNSFKHNTNNIPRIPISKKLKYLN